MALLLAAAVAAAMIAIGAHTFTDAVAGAAVGTGVVLACALTLDLWLAERAEHQRSDLTLPGGRGWTRAVAVETPDDRGRLRARRLNDSVHSDDQHVA